VQPIYLGIMVLVLNHELVPVRHRFRLATRHQSQIATGRLTLLRASRHLLPTQLTHFRLQLSAAFCHHHPHPHLRTRHRPRHVLPLTG
jgi:hypothetical protein